MNNPLYLFGAGASAFCGTGVMPQNPPLATDLFDKLASDDPFFANIDAKTALIFRNNFETGMEVWLRKHRIDEPLFRLKMARYFLQFKVDNPDANNHYCRFWYLASRSHDRFSTASLNYDLLLEDAWQSLKHRPCWKTALKLHGAANFIPSGVRISQSKFLARDANTSGLTVRAVSRDEALAFCKTNDSIGPSMSMVVIGKPVLDSPEVVIEERKSFKDTIAKVDNIIIIGVNLNELDSHLWEPLAEARKPIKVVNPDFESYAKWARDKGLRIKHLCKTFSEFVTTPRFFGEG